MEQKKKDVTQFMQAVSKHHFGNFSAAFQSETEKNVNQNTQKVSGKHSRRLIMSNLLLTNKRICP